MKRFTLSGNDLKFIDIIAMTIDHLGYCYRDKGWKSHQHGIERFIC